MTFEQQPGFTDAGAQVWAHTADWWDGPVFIVGMPRSGIRFLRSLLSKHPRIRILTAETDFLPFMDQWVERRGSPVTAEAFRQLASSLQNASYFDSRSASHPFRWQEWRTACNGSFDVGGLFEGFARYELELEPDAGVVMVDHSAAYVRHIPLLLKHFPSARVLHVVRDVRDLCVSVRNTWGKDLRRSAWRWGQDVLTAHRQCLLMAERCLEVKFEELQQNPAQQMRRICLFLDLTFSPELTRGSEPVEENSRVAGRAGIVRDPARKFETRLTPSEIASIESLAWHAMQALSYRPVTRAKQSSLSPVMQRMLKLKDGAHLMANSMSRHGLAGAIRFHSTHRRTPS